MPKTHKELVDELTALIATSETIQARKSEIVQALNVAAGPFTLNVIEGIVTVSTGRVELSTIPTDAIRKMAEAMIEIADRLDGK